MARFVPFRSDARVYEGTSPAFSGEVLRDGDWHDRALLLIAPALSQERYRSGFRLPERVRLLLAAVD